MPTTYTIRPGDTLSSIAKRYGVDTQQLAKANHIVDANRIWGGQTLTIPNPNAADVFVPAPVTPAAKVTTVCDRVLAQAQKRVEQFGPSYAVAASAFSPNPKFPGNAHPDATALGSTKGVWKCNMFVGDVLSAAGLKPPQYGDGWYALSQEWHGYTDRFTVIAAAKAQPGDVLTIDRGATKESEGGGHAVVLASTIRADGSYECYGATRDGACKTTRNIHTDTQGVDDQGQPYKVYVLRPKI